MFGFTVHCICVTVFIFSPFDTCVWRRFSWC